MHKTTITMVSLRPDFSLTNDTAPSQLSYGVGVLHEFKIASQTTLGKSYGHQNASKATLKNVGKSIIWINWELVI